MRQRRGQSPAVLLACFAAAFLAVLALGRCAMRTADEGQAPAPTATVGPMSTAAPTAVVSNTQEPLRPTEGGHVAATVTAEPVEATREPEVQPTRRPPQEATATTVPPVSTETPSSQPSPTAQTRYYLVKAGDTLWSISRRFGITVEELARANGLSEDTVLQIGQRLLIPVPGGNGGGLVLPDVAARVAPPANEGELGDLAPAVVRYLEGRDGESAAAVYVPSTDTMYTWNGDVSFEMASIVKVPIMLTQLAQQYERDPEAELPGTELLVPMITVSDNDAATALLDQVGGPPAVEAELRARGVNQTDVSGEAWGLSTTTAPDMALLMRSLYYGERLNEALRGVAIALMSSVVVEQRWGVPSGLSGSSEVAFKGGWLPVEGGWLVHQIGVASVGGETYIFAFFNKRQPTWEYGQESLRRAAELLVQRD